MQTREEDKIKKTGVLLALVNVVSCCTLGKIATTALNICLLYYFHELGKSRRKGQNFATSGRSFFASYLPAGWIDTNEAENAFRNVINGGEVIADEVIRL